jgi:putative PIN family toxin of toxin-antitoxin system
VRVLLDSNVLVSAFGTRGLCADVLRLVLSEHELVTADVVLAEVERILLMKFRLPQDAVYDIITFLREHPVEPKPEVEPGQRVRDPDDAWVLASALAAKTDILITGDADLLELGPEAQGLRIMKPREFWDLHRGT